VLDNHSQRIGREIFLAAFGAHTDAEDGWWLDRLTMLLEEHEVRAGELLWTEGRPIDHLYFFRKGSARLTREGSPPWTFDGRWFLGAFEAHAGAVKRRAVALTDFYTLRVARQAWLDLLEDSFELARRSLKAAADTVVRLEERIPILESAFLRKPTPAIPPGPLSVIDRLAILTDLPTARGAGVQALADLAAICQEVSLQAAEPLFAADEPTREHVFLLVTGEISVGREEPLVQRRYYPGEIVGGVVAFSDRGLRWSAHALTPARLLAIPTEAWFDLMEEHFEFEQAHFAAVAARRDRLLEELAAHSGPEGLVLK
jgi:CRP-like cAMP-binding protein